jgi:cytochrome b561
MHGAPAWPASLPDWQRRAALGVHRALYACMVVMPVSGYVGSNFSKHGVHFFGTSLPAWGPDLPPAYAFFNGLHVATAWIFSTLILVHVAAALQHGLVDRDGVMTRIWPKAPT